MIRDNEKGEEFGFGHGGLFMRSRPAFAIGLMVWLYFPIVVTCKSLELGRAIGFPGREEGLSLDFFLDVACNQFD